MINACKDGIPLRTLTISRKDAKISHKSYETQQGITAILSTAEVALCLMPDIYLLMYQKLTEHVTLNTEWVMQKALYLELWEQNGQGESNLHLKAE